MTRARNRLLDAAVRIGEALCARAYWHEERCNWVGRSPREMTEPGKPLTPTVAALGPELYSGTAGIGLFLAELHRRSTSPEFRNTASGAIRHALSKSGEMSPSNRRSFYSGALGIAYAATRVGLIFGESDFVRAGVDLATSAVSSNGEHLLDVIGGNAGAVAPLLWMSGLPGAERLREGAVALAAELAAAAVKEDGIWRWENDRACGRGMGPTSLCGLAHGASGMGLALIEMGATFHRTDWIQGGLAAFAYEDRHYDAQRENWPDLREFPEPRDGTRPQPAKRAPSFMKAWCHGAPGIGLARLRAAQLLSENRDTLMAAARNAIHATTAQLESLPAEADASPCHGRAGLAETLIYATHVLGDPEHAARATRAWRSSVRRFFTEPSEWPCGVASGWNNPSLMLGHAGIGYALLRADDPSASPSLLLVEPAA
jgi:class II lanthipeptide synthase